MEMSPRDFYDAGDKHSAISLLERQRENAPLDKDDLVILGLSYRDVGRRQDALAVFQEGTTRFPFFAPNFVWAGDACFDLKRFPQAELYYRSALSVDPCSVGGRIGLGHLSRRNSERFDALNWFLSAIPFSQSNSYLYISAAWELSILGCHDEATTLLNSYNRINPASLPSIAVAHSFSHYLKLYSVQQTVDDYTAMWSSHKSIGTADLLDSIAESISKSTPLSFIRLGDGEGSFVGHMRIMQTSHYNSLKHLTEWSCNYILANWFGKDIEKLDYSHKHRLYEDLINAIKSSNIIGAPRPARIEFEARNDRRGYFGVSQILPILNEYANGFMLTNADSHVSIAKDPRFFKVLSMAPFLGTIGCHPTLGTKLRASLSIANGVDFLVPGELGSNLLPRDLKLGRHFPDRYEEILTLIDQIQPGSVFLVGAGVLGKIYCSRIRSAGGIAIDMGAVFDVWMGLKTRGVFEVAEIAPL